MNHCRLFRNNYAKSKNTVYSNYLNFVRHKCEGTKVVLLNSYSKVGILTAYLLKKKNLFSEICLYEPSRAPTLEGTVHDLNNITKTCAHVTHYTGKTNLICALKDANIVVMMEKYAPLCIQTENSDCKSKDKCKTPLDIAAEKTNVAFMKNAEYCSDIAKTYAMICPTALFVNAVRPVNSTLPLVCRVAGRINYNVDTTRMLGFTTMDVVTANLLYARSTKMKLENIKVPVVGGTSAYTAVPLYSQVQLPKKKKKPKDEDKKKTKDEEKTKTKDGDKRKAKDTDKTKAKDKGKTKTKDGKETKPKDKGETKAKKKHETKKEKTDEEKKKEAEEIRKKEEKEKRDLLAKKLTAELRKSNEMLLINPTAPLATAAAISRIVIALGNALRGHELKEYAYVQSNIVPNVRYLAGPIQLGPAGVQKAMALPKLSDYENILLESAAYYLVADIKVGEDYAEKYLADGEDG